MKGKNNWDSRFKQFKKKSNLKIPFLIQNITVEELFDETGEVKEDTIIKISFDGLLMYISIANAYKLASLLNKTLKT